MSLRDVMAFIQQHHAAGAATAATAVKTMPLQRKPNAHAGCTPATAETSRLHEVQASAQTGHTKAAANDSSASASTSPQPPAPAHQQRTSNVTCNAPATAGNVAAPGQHHADTVPTPEPEPTDWLVLDRAYQAHHFKCAVCIAAGRGTRYGQRCGVGAALWANYDHASRNTPPPWHKPKGKK